ncbi:N/A [soil metagenome]
MTSLVKRSAATRRGDGSARTEYLAFLLAKDIYAVRIGEVAEIIRPPPITEIPRAPSPIVGVVSVRGRLVTVIDLRRRFHLPETPFDKRTKIPLVAAADDEHIGLLVDEVRQVYRLGVDEIEPAAVLGGEQPAHILGIGRPKSGQVIGQKRIGELVLVLLDLRPVVEV